ncbi:MAG: DUF4270 family protein [Cytophagales bacterium]|nr:DUF4270 family protein [Cytophagales bacterium]
MISISSKKLIWKCPAIKWVGILSLFLVSCDTPKEIGDDLFSVEVGLNYSDTITIKSSTVLIDSIYTGSPGTLLIGTYNHPVLGLAESSAFTQFSNIDTLFSKATSVYDSLTMRLAYSGYQGDTTQSMTMNVYRLLDSLNRGGTDYFANSTIRSDASVLGSHTFKPRPIRTKAANGDSVQLDTLRFRMSDAFRRELLSKYADVKVAAGSKGFRDYFPGMLFKSSSSSAGAMIGFNPGYSRMTLYFHNPGDPFLYSMDYYFSLSNALFPELLARFNQIKSNKSVALAGLKNPGDLVPSATTSGLTYIQAGTGVATKVEFPYLLNLKGNRNVAVNKAELVLTAGDNIDLQQTIGQLSIVETNATNRTLRNSYGLKYLLSEGGASVITSAIEPGSKTYTFNVTTAIQSILVGKQANSGWIITPALTSNSAGNTRIINESTRFVPLQAMKARLKIYYSYIAK